MNTYSGGSGNLGACFLGRPRFPFLNVESGARGEIGRGRGGGRGGVVVGGGGVRGGEGA